MKELELLFNQWHELQPLKPEYEKKLRDKFMLDFNFNSTHIEGNTLTYGQTKLLLFFGKTTGSANLRDYEEMKAHNVGLEIVKREALDKERPLSELFIRELNRVILVENFKKPSEDKKTMYEVQVGVYKTRSNHVFTASGEIFYYATPEETPAMMNDLIGWYNSEENKHKLNPIELAALLHYRYVRIHPFDDGNGRIARLLMNYVLLRHGYPMIIVKSNDKENYLNTLNVCDVAVGLSPYEGANAKLEDIQPFVDYVKKLVKYSLTISIKAARGENIDEETDWKKKLSLKQKEIKNAPLYSVPLAKQANEESFLFLVKKIDNELSTFYNLFDRIVYGNEIHSVISKSELLSTVMHNKSYNRRGFNFSKTLISKGKLTVSFELGIVFRNQYYSLIANLAMKEKEDNQLKADFNYGEKISEEIATEFVVFVGEFLAEFVKEQLN